MCVRSNVLLRSVPLLHQRSTSSSAGSARYVLRAGHRTFACVLHSYADRGRIVRASSGSTSLHARAGRGSESGRAVAADHCLRASGLRASSSRTSALQQSVQPVLLHAAWRTGSVRAAAVLGLSIQVQWPSVGSERSGLLLHSGKY